VRTSARVVETQTVELLTVLPDGYRAMNERESIKVIITF
jgi:hypothetical protein